MKAHQIATASPAISGQLDNAGGRLLWWAWAETTGSTPAVFNIWDGSNNAGRLMIPFTLSPNGSTRDYPGLHSLPYETGLYLEVVSGSIKGSVYVVSGRWDTEHPLPVVILGDVTIGPIEVTP